MESHASWRRGSADRHRGTSRQAPSSALGSVSTRRKTFNVARCVLACAHQLHDPDAGSRRIHLTPQGATSTQQHHSLWKGPLGGFLHR